MQAPIVTFSYGHRKCSYILPLVDHNRVFMELGIPTEFAEVLFDMSSVQIVDPEKIICCKLEILSDADVIKAIMYRAELSKYICLTTIVIFISSLRENYCFVSKVGDWTTICGPYQAQIHTEFELLDTAPVPISSTVTISGSEDLPLISAQVNGSGVIHRYVVKSVYPGDISKSTIVECASVVQFQNPNNLVVLDDALDCSDEYTLLIKFKSIGWFIKMLVISINIDAEVKPGRQKSANK